MLFFYVCFYLCFSFFFLFFFVLSYPHQNLSSYPYPVTPLPSLCISVFICVVLSYFLLLFFSFLPFYVLTKSFLTIPIFTPYYQAPTALFYPLTASSHTSEKHTKIFQHCSFPHQVQPTLLPFHILIKTFPVICILSLYYQASNALFHPLTASPRVLEPHQDLSNFSFSPSPNPQHILLPYHILTKPFLAIGILSPHYQVSKLLFNPLIASLHVLEPRQDLPNFLSPSPNS